MSAEVVQRTISLDEIHQRQTGRRTSPLVHCENGVVRKENRWNANRQRKEKSIRILLQHRLESIQLIYGEASAEMTQGKLIRINSNESQRAALRLKHLLVDR